MQQGRVFYDWGCEEAPWDSPNLDFEKCGILSIKGRIAHDISRTTLRRQRDIIYLRYARLGCSAREIEKLLRFAARSERHIGRRVEHIRSVEASGGEYKLDTPGRRLRHRRDNLYMWLVDEVGMTLADVARAVKYAALHNRKIHERVGQARKYVDRLHGEVA